MMCNPTNKPSQNSEIIDIPIFTEISKIIFHIAHPLIFPPKTNSQPILAGRSTSTRKTTHIQNPSTLTYPQAYLHAILPRMISSHS